MSIVWITAAFLRSQTETLVDPFAADASHVPFSENEMASIGPVDSKLAAFAPVLTSNNFI